MSRPYLHLPLPRALKRLWRAPWTWLGLFYTPYSLATREAQFHAALTDARETIAYIEHVVPSARDLIARRRAAQQARWEDIR